MLLKNKHSKNANVKVNLPVVGEVKLVDGVIDVPEDVHDLLIGDGLNEWTTGEEVPEEAAENVEDKGDEDEDEFKAMVNSLSFEEVKSLAEEAKIKNWKIFSKKEKALRTFVIKKLKEANAEEFQKQLEIDGDESTGSPDEE